jgi:hypothetical protein
MNAGGIDKHRILEEPRLRLDGPGKVECFLCGKAEARGFLDWAFRRPPKNMLACDAGIDPTLYFHRACGLGHDGAEMEMLYADAVARIFNRRGTPLMSG